jgi:hypothetical protein
MLTRCCDAFRVHDRDGHDDDDDTAYDDVGDHNHALLSCNVVLIAIAATAAAC